MPAAKQTRPIAPNRCRRRWRHACRARGAAGVTLPVRWPTARSAGRGPWARGLRRAEARGGGRRRGGRPATRRGAPARRARDSRRPRVVLDRRCLLGPRDRLGLARVLGLDGGPGAASTPGDAARVPLGSARASRVGARRLGLELRLGRDDERVVGLEVPRLALGVVLSHRLLAQQGAHRREVVGEHRRLEDLLLRRPVVCPPRATWAGRRAAPRRCCDRGWRGPAPSARRSSAAARGGPPRRPGHLAHRVPRRLGADDAHTPGVIARRLLVDRSARVGVGVLGVGDSRRSP